MNEVLVHTGQHYDSNMSDVFFRDLEIEPPRHSLEVGSGPHGWQTGLMLERIEKVLVEEKPQWVVVYGDTNSTLAGALAAAKLHIPIAHVEAGLRSFNRQMPEEINRVLTDHASELLLAPTEQAVQHLRNEGLTTERIVLVGDVMYDAALWYAPRAPSMLEALKLEPQRYVLATIHRAENTDDAEVLGNIIDGLILTSKTIPIVWPIHPRTRARLEDLGWLERVSKHLMVIAPCGYLEMIALERTAKAIATDSGGVQKEAFFVRVPCCTLRSETEWVELVALGWNRLVTPTSAARVHEGILASLDQRGAEASPYGDGHAGERIVDALAGTS